MTNTPKLFCPSMWKSIHVDSDGYLTPCCIHIDQEDKNIRIEDVNHIETVLFENHKERRQQLHDGIWPDGCHQCKFAESEGRSSKRLQDLSGTPELDYEVALEYLQLKTGRICNLQCTICSPRCSTSIASHLLKTGEIDQNYYDILQNEIAWASDIKQYDKMTSAKGYYRIDIAGGEPLLNKTHFEWLDKIASKNTQLLYNSNGTIRPTEEQIKVWERFKGIWMSYSIDSYEDRFEKLRVGAKWKTVLSNLKYFQEEIINKRFNRETSNICNCMTIHAENVMDIISLYERLTEHVIFTHQDPINLNYLYYPEFRAAHNMPKHYIEQIINHFDKNIHRLPQGSRIKNEVNNLRNSLETFLINKQSNTPRPIMLDHRNTLDLKFIEQGILNNKLKYGA